MAIKYQPMFHPQQTEVEDYEYEDGPRLPVNYPIPTAFVDPFDTLEEANAWNWECSGQNEEGFKNNYYVTEVEADEKVQATGILKTTESPRYWDEEPD